jgi:catechol 2,3-dioxygenase-like lactoylglutathione lyase family enzyme
MWHLLFWAIVSLALGQASAAPVVIGNAASSRCKGAQAAQIPSSAGPPETLRGIAQVSIFVSDLRKSTEYYGGVLGFTVAFDLNGKAGASRYFKINDSQYLELIQSAKAGNLVRQARIVFEASDLAALRSEYLRRCTSPGPITREMDGNPVFRMTAPNGIVLDFKQYAAGSRQVRLKGKLLDNRRIATHLLHAGALVTDEVTKPFLQRLGLIGAPFGPRGEYLETPATDRNLETKNPPLDPENPATRDRYLREVYGATHHFALEISDMHAVREELKRRGNYDDVRLRTAVGNNRHWLIHLFDPDGSRTEFMSRDTLPDDVPSFSVMPPGPPAAPIKAVQKGVYPWP